MTPTQSDEELKKCKRMIEFLKAENKMLAERVILQEAEIIKRLMDNGVIKYGRQSKQAQGGE